MTFVDAVRTCFAKYADFTGRATRSEFWWWVLFVIVVSIILEMFNDWVSVAFSLATLLPYLAVSARRLHDTDRSGWFQLLGFIPVIGWIILLIWYVQDSKGSTRFD